MTQLEIHVRGTGTSIRRAERGIIILEAYSSRHETQAEASKIVTDTATFVRNTITPFCPQDQDYVSIPTNTPATAHAKDPTAAIAHYTMSTLETNSHSEYIQNEKKGENGHYHYTYSAKCVFTIKFADFDVLDQLATTLSGTENVRINRIDWALTDATLLTVKSEARKAAAADAYHRARDFAEILVGGDAAEARNKVKAVELREDRNYGRRTQPGLHMGKVQRHREMEEMRRRAMEKAREDLWFEPEDVRVEVDVEGTFAVEV